MLLEVRELSYKYDELLVLENVSFSVESGEILQIVGNNGSGKTTLLKCISGILNEGRNIYIDGQEIINSDKRCCISYILPDDILYDYLTVKENIKFFAELFKEGNNFIDSVYEFMRDIKVLEYSDYLVKHLSSGTRHKIYLAIMLSRKHSILILDEPLSTLDIETQIYMKKYLEKMADDGKIILFVTHIKEFEDIATSKVYLKSKEY